MKYVSYLLGGLSGAAAGGYFVLYLYRWEWQRALISGVLLLAIEVLLVATVLIARMSRLEREVAHGRDRTEELLRNAARSRRETAPRFRWLDGQRPDGTTRTFVFVPVLVAAGALMSAVAWAVQKIAAATGRPADRRLADRLTSLAPPEGGPSGAAQLEERPAVPRPRRLRAAALAAAAVLGAGGFWLSVGELSDATQTRAQRAPSAAATTVVFEVRVRGAEGETAERLAARELWESCRRSTRVVARHAPLSRLDGAIWVGNVRPALGEHDRMRLRGCLDDATAHRTRATVLGDGQSG